MSNILSRLKNRGCIYDASNFAELDTFLQRESVCFYCGFDPTADSLHVGSMLPLLLMRRLQRAGHRAIALLGTATGMIGDPSGKSAERNLLDEQTLSRNVAGIERQIGVFLELDGVNAAKMVKNEQWLKPLSCIEFLRDVGKHFSVNSMMLKESVRSRLEGRDHGISYTEFSYMLLQAYDYYWLYKNHGCRLQVGGSDQWGNITAGLELIRRKAGENSPSAYALTFPLLTTSTGGKFGKSEQGTVWLDAEKTSPYQFFQFWFNTADADVIKYLRLFSELEDEHIAELEQSLDREPELRQAQRALAFELTSLVHGRAEAEKVTQASEVLFNKGIGSLDSKTLLEINRDVPSLTLLPKEVELGIPIQDLLVRTGLAKSKSDARRLLDAGGVYVNDGRIQDISKRLELADFIEGKVLILRSGKKNKHLVRVAP